MRRFLLVTYYFPPSGGPGVQRSLKLAKYLPACGWEPAVITVDPDHAAYPGTDASLEAEVPAEIEVVRTGSWDPYAAYARLMGKRREDAVGVSFVGTTPANPKERLARWVRANCFVPDARMGWVPFARRAAIRLARAGRFDAVVTSGPPHSTHFVGRSVRRHCGIPWVADLRDPWTGIHHYDQFPATALARALDRRMEERVLREADRVVVVSPTMATQFAVSVPRTYDVITNGFDPDDFRAAALPPAGDRFVIRHIGNLSRTQIPGTLWLALRDLESEVGKLVRVELIGNVDGTAMEAAARYGVQEQVKVLPYVDHGEAVRLMRTSHALLLVINDVPQAASIVTGKIFEYVASGRPVVGIVLEHGDAASILRTARAGRMSAHDDVAAVAAQVRGLVSDWRDGRALRGAPAEVAAAFGRDRQAAQLARLLEGLPNAGRD